MALIVAGATVTSGANLDATKLTGNLPAISGASLTALAAANITANGTLPALNGSNLTSLPSSSPAVNTVGSYAFLSRNANTVTDAGGTRSDNLYFSGAGGGANEGGVAGTWRCMGKQLTFNTGGEYATTLWLRIS